MRPLRFGTPSRSCHRLIAAAGDPSLRRSLDQGLDPPPQSVDSDELHPDRVGAGLLLKTRPLKGPLRGGHAIIVLGIPRFRDVVFEAVGINLT